MYSEQEQVHGFFFEDGRHPFGAQPQKNGGSPEVISGSPPDIKF